jgi:hypothetical protein
MCHSEYIGMAPLSFVCMSGATLLYTSIRVLTWYQSLLSLPYNKCASVSVVCYRDILRNHLHILHHMPHLYAPSLQYLAYVVLVSEGIVSLICLSSSVSLYPIDHTSLVISAATATAACIRLGMLSALVASIGFLVITVAVACSITSSFNTVTVIVDDSESLL